MQAKLIFLEVFTHDTERSQDFYGSLFGVDAFARIPTPEVRSYQMPISADDIDLHITQIWTDNPPRIVPYFAVKSLRRAIDYLQEKGGKMIAKPFPTRVPEEFFEQFRDKAHRRLVQVDPEVDISGKLGDVALMVDPDGNPIGLMELEEYVHFSYGWGKHRRPLTEAQIEDHMTTLRLSQRLLYEEKQAN